ncbi:MAG: hypothetical protein OQK78_11720 [Gammaproteobacteria bacterium]|nr:hypothetical protein [Gammaproteobacteria bacterium]
MIDDYLDKPLFPEDAWRCYNVDQMTDYDMPPDKYRYTVEALHGSTTDDNMQNINVGGSYYGDINSSAGSIVNFWNSADKALEAWEFNQLTKPDYLPIGAPTWHYTNEAVDCAGGPRDLVSGIFDAVADLAEAVVCNAMYSEVTDQFLKNGDELTWSEQLTADSANILSHIIPGRTKALGQEITRGVIDEENNIEMDGLSNSNHDHSAQFHGYYSETRGGGQWEIRKSYWNNVLLTSLGLNSRDGGLSGLGDQ